MGVKLFWYGNSWGNRTAEAYNALQWSRNFLVTEIENYWKYKTIVGGLQWGHNFFVMEIFRWKMRSKNTERCFNGAVTFLLWKYVGGTP